MKIAVVALGGNAILLPGQRGTYFEQLANVRRAIDAVLDLEAAGYQLVLTHGNGPQVGNLLLQQEEAVAVVPPLPLFACGGMSQGLLGLMLEQAIHDARRRRGQDGLVATLVTLVLVDPGDPAMTTPNKPVGPFYTEPRVRELAQEGLVFREDAGRGWRRVVPSPQPRRIMNAAAVRQLLAAGALVIAAGGGGVPVTENPETGELEGVDAVIDKDRASCRLALDLAAEVLMILTDVPAVAVNYRHPDQRWLSQVTVPELEEMQRQGHFGAGSMGPKVEAAIEFVRNGGDRAIIARLDQARLALEGRIGTHVVAGRRACATSSP